MTVFCGKPWSSLPKAENNPAKPVHSPVQTGLFYTRVLEIRHSSYCHLQELETLLQELTNPAYAEVRLLLIKELHGVPHDQPPISALPAPYGQLMKPPGYNRYAAYAKYSWLTLSCPAEQSPPPERKGLLRLRRRNRLCQRLRRCPFHSVLLR